MRKSIWILLLLSTVAAWAQSEMPKNGEIYDRLQGSLTSGGPRVTVGLRAFSATPEGCLGQLVVVDGGGRTLWSGPKDSTFGRFEYGSAELQVLGDIDGDGAVELVGTTPVSDVRAQPFRIYRWRGDRFVQVRLGSLVADAGGTYVWKTGNIPEGRWVAAFRKVPGKGQVEVDITEYTNGHGGQGRAILAANGEKFKVQKWLELLKLQ